MATNPTRFSEGELFGKTDSELLALLRPEDVFDPDGTCTPGSVAAKINRSADQMFEVFSRSYRRPSGGPPAEISDVRGTQDHPSTFGKNVLAWMRKTPGVKLELSPQWLQLWKGQHPELFRQPLGDCDLAERLRRETDFEARAEAEERQRRDAERAAQFDELAVVLARCDAPADGDVAEVLRLARCLLLTDTQIQQIARHAADAVRIERRRAEGQVSQADAAELAAIASRYPWLFTDGPDGLSMKYRAVPTVSPDGPLREFDTAPACSRG